MSEHLPPGFGDSEVIGRGGFAVVYRAMQLAVNRQVAIKVLDEANVSDDVQRRFRRECVAVGALSWHPHIAQLFDAGVNGLGRNYMVLEYLPNGSLADLLAEGPLDEVRAVEYLIQISDALHAAHTEGVLHRDIKPDNILLDRLDRAKLADFGIADMRDGTKTKTGTITATVSYAAPEVLGGERAGAASDVYGLGATLHTLISGRAPFDSETHQDLIAMIGRIITADPPDLRRSGASGGVADAVKKSLEKDPTDRFESALDFGRALQAAQRDNENRVTPMPFADRRLASAASDSPSTVDLRETAPAVADDPPVPGSGTGSVEDNLAAASAQPAIAPATPEPIIADASAPEQAAEDLADVERPVDATPAHASAEIVTVEPPPAEVVVEEPVTPPRAVIPPVAAPAPAAKPAQPKPAEPQHAEPQPAVPDPTVITPANPAAPQTLIGSGPAAVQAPISSPPISSPPLSRPPQSPSRKTPILAGLVALLVIGGLGAFFALRDSGDDPTPNPVEVADPAGEEPADDEQPAPTPEVAPTSDPVPTEAPETDDQTDPPPTPTTPPPTPVPAVALATGEGIEIAGNYSLTSAGCSGFETFAEFSLPLNTECSVLTVPENWTEPDGTQIELDVAVFRSTSLNPAPDPIVRVIGGPGFRAIKAYSIPTLYDRLTAPFLADRDFIVYNQRGGELTCEDFLTLPIDVSVEEGIATQQACYATLRATGADLTQYSAAANAHDIEALRSAFGLGQINLLGDSYGTRFSLTYARIYEPNVRSLVLEAVRPVDYDPVAQLPVGFEESLERVFTRCAGDPSCAARYPNLRDTFIRLVDRLSSQPGEAAYIDADGIRVDFELDDLRFLETLFGMLNERDRIAQIPKVINDQFVDNFSPELGPYVANNADSNAEFIAFGQFYITVCNDEVRFSNEAAIAAALPPAPYSLYANPALSGQSLFDCNGLPPYEPAPVENEPVVVDIPTLLFNGGFDPVTPTSGAVAIDSRLPNSQLVVFPDDAHGVLNFASDPALWPEDPAEECGMSIATAFLADPFASVDQSCVANEPAIVFE